MSARYWVLRRKAITLGGRSLAKVYIGDSHAVGGVYALTTFFEATHYNTKEQARMVLRSLPVFAVDYAVVRVDCTETPPPMLSHGQQTSRTTKPARQRKPLH